MKLRIAIVDDEPLARDRLRRLLKGDSEVEVVVECEDAASAMEAVKREHPDLLLLDVQMPGMDGFELLRKLDPAEIPQVVFVTGHDIHAVKAFEARALDYLLKPTTRARLAEALRRVRERLAANAAPEIPRPLLDLLAEHESVSSRLRRLAVRAGERTTFVSVDEIDWIEAAGNYVVLHVGTARHVLRETMGALEEQLPADAFLRANRSAILNLRRIKELQTVSPNEHVALLNTGERIPLTKSLREIENRLRFV